MFDFNQIYEAHKDLVYNLAFQYVQQAEEAEEIMQDVFLRIHEKRHNFREEATLKTWIYRITVNRSIDFLRSKKRKNTLLSLFFLSKKDDPENNKWYHPGFSLEQQEKVQAIFKIINSLPPQQKSALLLVKMEGLSMKECASVLNTSEKAIESLLSRAKFTLKNKLSNEG